MSKSHTTNLFNQEKTTETDDNILRLQLPLQINMLKTADDKINEKDLLMPT